MSLIYGSLFSGCGGLDYGLELAGLTCAFQVENDPDARAVLARHWPDIRRPADIRDFPSGPAVDWRCDLLVGGDPCQENTAARVTRGTRAPSLGAEFLRVVDILRPRLVLRENPTRSRTDAPWPWWRFRDHLEDLGYVVLPFRLRACCFGADHRRDRLFLLAEHADADRQQLRLQGRGTDAGAAGASEAATRERERVRPDLRAVVCGQRRGPDAGDGRGDARTPGRLDRLRMLGNAVDVRVGRWIGEQLLRSVAEVTL